MQNTLVKVLREKSFTFVFGMRPDSSCDDGVLHARSVFVFFQTFDGAKANYTQRISKNRPDMKTLFRTYSFFSNA